MLHAARVAGIVVVGAATIAAGSTARPEKHADSRMEGSFEYVGTLKGQSIITNGRFVLLYGPSDGSTPMTSDAGTYRIVHDTATHTITYSTDPARVGTVFHWTPESWSGDTLSYVVMDAQGKAVDRGRAIRLK